MRLVKSFFIISSLVLSGARSTLKGDSELSTSGELPKASTLTPAAEAWSSTAGESDGDVDAVLDTATMAEDAPCTNYTCCDTDATVCAMQNYQNITYYFSNILNCVAGDCPTGWVNATTPPPAGNGSSEGISFGISDGCFLGMGVILILAVVEQVRAYTKPLSDETKKVCWILIGGSTVSLLDNLAGRMVHGQDGGGFGAAVGALLGGGAVAVGLFCCKSEQKGCCGYTVARVEELKQPLINGV